MWRIVCNSWWRPPPPRPPPRPVYLPVTPWAQTPALIRAHGCSDTLSRRAAPTLALAPTLHSLTRFLTQPCPYRPNSDPHPNGIVEQGHGYWCNTVTGESAWALPESTEGEGGYPQATEGEYPESGAPTPQPATEGEYPAGTEGEYPAGTEAPSATEQEGVYMHNHNCAVSATPLSTDHGAAVAAAAVATTPAESDLPDAFCAAKQDHFLFGSYPSPLPPLPEDAADTFPFGAAADDTAVSSPTGDGGVPADLFGPPPAASSASSASSATAAAASGQRARPRAARAYVHTPLGYAAFAEQNAFLPP